MRVYKSLSSGLLALAMLGCTTPRLPDPTVEYPKPPAALMQPSQNMQVIPLEDSN